jgi:collagen type III alpha
MKQRFGTLDDAQPAPESEARKRQFEELLKGLDFRSDAATRKARTDRERKVDGFGGRDVPPPAEYREAADAFSRALPKLFEEAKPRK